MSTYFWPYSVQLSSLKHTSKLRHQTCKNIRNITIKMSKTELTGLGFHSQNVTEPLLILNCTVQNMITTLSIFIQQIEFSVMKSSFFCEHCNFMGNLLFLFPRWNNLFTVSQCYALA